MRLLTALLLPALAAAEVHTIVATKYYDTFARAHEVLLRVKAGDTVRTKTIDAYGADYQGARVAANLVNGLTGPFFVEGAEPGDSLAVRVVKLRCNRNWGWTSYRLGAFALLPEYLKTVYPNQYKPGLVHPGRDNNIPWDIDVRRQTVRLREPVSGRLRLEYRAQPMLGCIGVAPEGDAAIPSRPSGAYGGNLDYNEVREGATVLLPVYHPGALLFVGDGHALQADGEPLGTGIETSMDVEFTVGLRRGAPLTGPRLENREFIISIGSQPEFNSSLDTALRIATTGMARWLVNDYGLEPWAAHQLIGVHGSYQVVTVAGSMALRIPRRYLPPRPARPVRQ
jgi:acetamidase/formamidase